MDEVRPTFSHHAQMAQMRQSTSSWRANKRGASPLVPEGPMAVRLKKFAPIGNEPSLCSLLCRIVPQDTPPQTASASPPGAGAFLCALASVCTKPGGIARCASSGAAMRRPAFRGTGPRLRRGNFRRSPASSRFGGGQLWILEKVLCFGCLACRCRSFCCWHCFGTIEDDQPCSSLRMRWSTSPRTRGGRPNSGNRRRVE